ncbi:unnamed protein product [Amoebophrya sp. A120]|nr:unnamed protein product [Amoebophrya sp. A120]|eukprot:GSA120T00014064001.1
MLIFLSRLVKSTQGCNVDLFGLFSEIDRICGEKLDKESDRDMAEYEHGKDLQILLAVLAEKKAEAERKKQEDELLRSLRSDVQQAVQQAVAVDGPRNKLKLHSRTMDERETGASVVVIGGRDLAMDDNFGGLGVRDNQRNCATPHSHMMNNDSPYSCAGVQDHMVSGNYARRAGAQVQLGDQSFVVFSPRPTSSRDVSVGSTSRRDSHRNKHIGARREIFGGQEESAGPDDLPSSSKHNLRVEQQLQLLSPTASDSDSSFLPVSKEKGRLGRDRKTAQLRGHDNNNSSGRRLRQHRAELYSNPSDACSDGDGGGFFNDASSLDEEKDRSRSRDNRIRAGQVNNKGSLSGTRRRSASSLDGRSSSSCEDHDNRPASPESKSRGVFRFLGRAGCGCQFSAEK